MYLQAMVSETRDASQFLNFVADVYSDLKPSLTSEVQRALIPSLRATADETQEQLKTKTEIEHTRALVNAYSALKDCIATPMDGSKRGAAQTAVLELISKPSGRRRSIVEYADVDSIRIGDVTPAPCQAILDKLSSP